MPTDMLLEINTPVSRNESGDFANHKNFTFGKVGFHNHTPLLNVQESLELEEDLTTFRDSK